MAKLKPWEDSDELWAVIEPLLPQRQRRFRHPGRKRLSDRLALQGILSVLHTGTAWEHLPQELGYGSGMTCRRRLNSLRQDLLTRARSGFLATTTCAVPAFLDPGLDAG